MISPQDPLTRVFLEIESEHQALTVLFRRLSSGEASNRDDGGWSPIDVLVHITAWQGNALQIARAQADLQAADINPHKSPAGILRLNVDQFNHQVLASHQGWTLNQAATWHSHINAELQSALRSLPVARLFGGPGRFGARMWYWRPAVIHSREHRRALERRLAT